MNKEDLIRLRENRKKQQRTNYYLVSKKEIEDIRKEYQGRKPSLLLHACCAVCASFPIEFLTQVFDVTIYFNNSNIWPSAEYERRLEELKRYISETGNTVKLIITPYDNEAYTRRLEPMKEDPEGAGRCFYCYAYRMNEAYRYAAEHHFDYFTTVMSISRQKDSQKMFDEKLDPAAVFSPLIKDLSLLDEISTPRKLEDALFAIAVSAQCNSLIDRRLLDFIPIEEICRLYECHNFRFFASKGPDTLYQKGRQWAFVWRTMQDILDKADSDLQTGEYAARLRFGHDIIVMSLLVLLDIDGYNKPVGSLDEVSGAFRSYEYPMSLNTQFIFYKNRKGDVLVRLLYNERDIALPIPDCGTPYFYRWQDFRQYALGRIEKAKQIIATTQAPPKKQ